MARLCCKKRGKMDVILFFIMINQVIIVIMLSNIWHEITRIKANFTIWSKTDINTENIEKKLDNFLSHYYGKDKGE